MSEHEAKPEQQESTSSVDYAALYKEQHPGAIEDIDKAKVMAQVGNPAETELADHRKNAIFHASKLGAPNHRDADYEARQAIEAAQKARIAADEIEDRAGDYYDQAKKI